MSTIATRQGTGSALYKELDFALRFATRLRWFPALAVLVLPWFTRTTLGLDLEASPFYWVGVSLLLVNSVHLSVHRLWVKGLKPDGRLDSWRRLRLLFWIQMGLDLALVGLAVYWAFGMARPLLLLFTMAFGLVGLLILAYLFGLLEYYLQSRRSASRRMGSPLLRPAPDAGKSHYSPNPGRGGALAGY